MLNIDRYHATMGDASYKEASRLSRGAALSETEATFYVTQRKLAAQAPAPIPSARQPSRTPRSKLG